MAANKKRKTIKGVETVYVKTPSSAGYITVSSTIPENGKISVVPDKVHYRKTVRVAKNENKLFVAGGRRIDDKISKVYMSIAKKHGKKF